MLYESIGAGIGMAVFAIVGLAGTLGMDYFRTSWQSSAMIVLAWFISRTVLIETLDMNDQGSAWAVGTAIGWLIGGFVMGRQLLKNKENG